MIADRRQFIIGAISLVGGNALLASCKGEPNIKPTDIAKTGPLFYSVAELELVTRLSDLILPRTETPGAIDAGVPAMLDGLMDQWANSKTQSNHRKDLTDIKAELDANSRGNFIAAENSVAEAGLREFDKAAFSDDHAHFAYQSLKQLIEVAYAASEAGSETYRRDPVPGYWDPAVPINTL